ncbi:MAG: hypothetical protein ACI4S4_00085 [Candidatus Ornithospirochaeta sp.]
MKKDRVVLKDFILSVLSAGGVGILIMMVFIPLILTILSRSVGGEEFPSFLYYMSGTVESIGAIIAITHIVLGSLVLQYMRFYMFMGLTRDRAFWRVMAVEGITLVVSFLFLFVVGTIVSLVSVDVSFKSILPLYLNLTCAFVLMFGVGCISSSISTTCRPPLSVGLVIVVLSFFIWVLERLSFLAEKVVADSDGIRIIIQSVFEGQESLVSLGIGVVMCLCAYFIYKTKISQMKSTSLS